MKESKFVRTKIVAGYLLLIAVCILSVGHVYRTTVRVYAPDSDLSVRIQDKQRAVNDVLFHLYQAESYGQLVIAGYASYERRYRSELRSVRSCLDSLRTFVAEGDSVQTMRLDSIAWLLRDKERRTMSLRNAIRASSTAAVLDRRVRELVAPRDSDSVATIVADSVAEPVAVRVISEDTVAVPRRKRRFFRRLADLFSPPKEDSSVVISRSEVVELPPAVVPVQDTIASVLLALQDSVMSGRQPVYDEAWREGQRLKYSNELVNAKIFSLLRDFDEEYTALLVARIARIDSIRQRSSKSLGYTAAGAVVLMLLFVAILWRDVSRSNRYRRELERANRANEALLAAREQLMLAITHDIKAPLGAVMGYIDLLSRLVGDKRQALYLQNMRGSSEHLLALVESLLDFYRLDLKKVELRKVAFAPGQLFESLVESFAAAAEAKGLSLTLELSPECGAEVSGDVLRIRQIAENLVSNALKFTDKGSVEVRVAVERGELVFSVRDTGRGIGREERERIFGEFVRLGSAQGVEGFGLGLSIVDRLLRLSGGHLSLESTPGEGSKFIVWIPVAEAVAEPEEPAAAGVRVLLVDDDPLQLEMAAAMCRRAGAEPACCAYAEYAAKLVREGSFDLVLTDLQMPSLDGFGVLEAVREVAPGLPVFAVSARTVDIGTLTARGFAGCLRKPFAFGELAAVLGGRDPEPPETARESAGGLRFEALTAFAGDDAEAAREILRTFAGQSAADCAALERAIAAADAAAIRAAAHKMLPVFELLGAGEVAAALRRIDAEGVLPEEPAAVLEKIREIVAEAQKKVSL